MKRLLSILLSVLIIAGCTAVPVQAADAVELDISADNISHDVSETLYGAFIEDISKACDGGLVSNLVYNNSFEYNDTDASNTQLNESYWRFSDVTHTISQVDPLNVHNTNYEIVTVSGTGTVSNLGCVENWDYKTWTPNSEKQSSPDMGFKAGEKYDFSCYIKNDDFSGTVRVYLDSPSNENKRTELDISDCSADWRIVSAVLESSETEDGALTIEFNGEGTLRLDFVSLIPQSSYGYGTDEWKFTTLRSDLAQAFIDMNPSFIRFPGGCFCEGDSIENLYDWKSTIGPVEERAQTYNVWRNDDAGDFYINSNAMGYGEYFNLCDDIGAEPVPCLNVGLTCQGRNNYDLNADAYATLGMTDDEFRQYLIDIRHYRTDDETGLNDRINAIKELGYQSEADWNTYLESITLTPGTAEWDSYVQDILDLIEFANGDSITTYWGALRAAYGHPEPYNLKYIQLGNENWGEVFWRNFDALYTAVKKSYPEITVITSAGAGAEGDAFDYAWDTVNSKYSDTYVDEHYYTISGNMYGMNDRYDSYDRTGAKVFVGEYNATSNGFGTMQTKSNIWEAIEEAAYMTGFERNGDVVAMTSYAPSLAKVNSQNWAINLIWFDSQSVALSPSYYTQMLFANNVGTKYINADFSSDIPVTELAQSVTVDEENQTIYVKLINSSGKNQRVNLKLSGFGELNYASNQNLSEFFQSACNEVGKPYYVTPSDDEPAISGDTVTVETGKYSINVIRIAYGSNNGDSLYSLPDMIPASKTYIPLAIKIAVPSAVGLVVIVAILTTVLVKAVRKKKAR